MAVVSASSNPFDDSFDDPAVNTTNPFEEGEPEVQAEANWQYLGDLPYRRVPIYSNVRWNGGNLASYPPAVLQKHQSALDRREVQGLLETTTTTKVVGCPHGGPLARVTLPVTSSSGWHHVTIRITTNAGEPLASIDFPPADYPDQKPVDLLQIGFTSRTTLVLVLRDSTILTYTLQGTPLLPPFMAMAQNAEVVQATVYEGGVAVLASNKNAALVELLDDEEEVTGHLLSRTIRQDNHCALITPLPTAEMAQQNFWNYMTLAVLPRSVQKPSEVFLSTSDHSVVVVNAATLEITDVECRARLSSPIVSMTFAPNGRFLACFTSSSLLTVISTSFETKVLDFDTSEGSTSPPLAMEWCGEDSVVLHWKGLGVLMVGPYGDWLRFPYDDQLYIVPEIDCCRVITDRSVELLQRVPPSTASLLRMGSIETSAMLLDASDSFEAGSSASDDAARAILDTGKLSEAIETCSEAAMKEFDISLQKRLLRAASYGMHFSFKVNGSDEQSIMGGSYTEPGDKENRVFPNAIGIQFVAAGRKLRIMNALRNPKVGFVLTSAQYDVIGPVGVVSRLIAMNRPALATSISKYLSLPKSVQLFARASRAAALVASDKTHTDSEVAEAAIRIINEEKSASSTTAAKKSSSSINRGGYATVAQAATKAGRPGVAKLLLMLESSVADKVPALISTGSYADAVAVATSARDADFIFTTVMEYEKACMAGASDANKARSAFFSTVVSKFTPEAFYMLQLYLETTPDTKNVTNLFLRAQKFAEAGTAMASQALAEDDIREKQGMLGEASNIFGLGKDTAFHKSTTDDFLDLLKDQEVLRTKYGTYDVAPECTSVAGTIENMLKFAGSHAREQHRLLADADKLARKFRLTEKRLWYVKVKAFSSTEQWSNLRSLAESKKSPIGYKPFVRAAIRGNQPTEEILRYMNRITVSEERYDLFCEAKLWKNALEEAYKLKDGRRIMSVKGLSNSPEMQLLADQMLSRLT